MLVSQRCSQEIGVPRTSLYTWPKHSELILSNYSVSDASDAFPSDAETNDYNFLAALAFVLSAYY